MKPAFRLAAAIVAVLVGAVCIIALAAWLALPGWIEARLVPDLARRYGLGNVGLDIRRISPFGLDAADIRIGDTLTLDSFALDFDPRDLARGRIRRITLCGLTLQAGRDDAGIHIAGLPRPAPAAATEPSTTQAPALWIGHFEVRCGLLIVQNPGGTLRIPFSLQATPKNDDLSRIEARLEIFPHQDPIRIMLQADTLRGDLSAVLQTEAARLDPFNALLPPSVNLNLQGHISGNAEARLALFPFQVRSLKGEATSDDLRIRTPDFELAAAGSRNPLRLAWSTSGRHDAAADFSGALEVVRPLATTIDDLKATATLKGGDSGRSELAFDASAALHSGPPWNAHIDIRSLKAGAHFNDRGCPAASVRLEATGRLDTPLPLSLDRLSVEATGDPAQIETNGQFVVHAAEGIIPGAMKIVPAGVEGFFSGRLEDLTRWQANVGVVPAASILELAAAGLTARITAPRLDIDLSGEKSALSFAARFTSRQGRIQPDGVDIAWPALNADTRGTLDLRDVPGSAEARFELGLSKPAVTIGDLQAGMRKVLIQGRIQPDRTPGLSAELRIEDGSLSWPSKSLSAEKIGMRLPLRWPAAGAPGGTLALKKLVWQDRSMGPLEAVVRQADRGLRLSGKLKDVLIQGLCLDVSGQAGVAGQGTTARLEIALAPWSPPAPVDLGAIVAAAAGLTADGQLGGRAKLSLDAGRLQSEAHIQITDAHVAAVQKKFRLDGIQADFELVDLTALRSAPGQIVRFAEARMGGVRLSDGTIQLQVEAPHQILLEKGSFGWCGGRVYAEAMRFSPAQDDYQLTLFCDRLGLADLLDQLGGLTVEGGGTVNGRIPLHYRQGRLSFKDGFLYSSPGDGGKIRLTGIERLTGGLGPETLEFAQLALAGEALKDYDYSWAKVGIDSQGDQLALRLQFDGKPAHPLPFVYRRELGRFVRVEADSPGSHFQGIGLDVNLRLPLNQILEYGGLMKMID